MNQTRRKSPSNALRRATFYGSVIVAVVGLFLIPRAEYPLELESFSWRIAGKEAPFEIQIRNRTDEEVNLVITVVAEHKAEGYDGTTISEEGRTKIEGTLGPNESKEMVGSVDLARFGTSALRLSPHVTIREPANLSASQSLEGTTETVD